MWWHKHLKPESNSHLSLSNQQIKHQKNQKFEIVFTSILLLPLIEPSDAAIFALTRIVRRETDEEEAPKFYKKNPEISKTKTQFEYAKALLEKCALDIEYMYIYTRYLCENWGGIKGEERGRIRV